MRQTNGGQSLESSGKSHWTTLSALDDEVLSAVLRIQPLQWSAFKGAIHAAARIGIGLTFDQLVECANRSGIQVSRSMVIAISLFAHSRRAVRIHFEVFHECFEQPLLCRDFEDGFQPTPWRCCNCGRLVEDPDEITYDMRVICANTDWRNFL